MAQLGRRTLSARRTPATQIHCSAACRRRSDASDIESVDELDRPAARLGRASTFDTPHRGWTALSRRPAQCSCMSPRARADAHDLMDPLHCMPASCPPTLEASRRAFRLRLMSPRAYRDREAKVSLLQRCRSGGRRRLTAPMLCTDAPTIGSGWGLHGMVFYGRRGLANACV